MSYLSVTAAINAGKILSFWNIPHFSYSSPDPILADKETYTTLLRLISPFNKLAIAMTDVFHFFEVSFLPKVETSSAFTVKKAHI